MLLLTRLAEASYTNHQGDEVYYQTGQPDDTLQDALDLYAVLAQDHDTGSPNLENDQALELVKTLQSGGLLSEAQIGTLLGLLQKHAPAIDELRRSPDRQGQDFLHIPDPATARVLTGRDDT